MKVLRTTAFVLVWLLGALAVVAPWGLGGGAGGPAQAAEVRNPNGVAVIIGNRNYLKGVGEVVYAHRDAEAFRRYVIDVLGFDPDYVWVLKDASFGDMRNELGAPGHPGKLHSLVERRQKLDDHGAAVSDVVVFYSGHGMPSLNLETPDSYLLPVDADPNAPERNGYSVETLYEMVGALPARSVSVFLDACFTGAGGDGVQIVRGSPGAATRLPEEVSENTVAFTAAEAQQIAYWDDEAGHGMFTQHVLDALYGGGDRDGDGAVTAREVERYLQEHLWNAVFKKNGREQDAVLLDGTGTGATVLAAAVEGAFPTRPRLDGPSPVVGRVGGNGPDDPSPRPLDLAAVTGGQAILWVETTPPGASVLVSGADVGSTPLERSDMRGGTYTVTLNHPTHETVVLQKQAMVEKEVLHIEQALKPATGKVTVITRPSGAWVEHEGERLSDSTPVTLDGLPSGPLVLTLGAADHHAVRVEVDVPKGSATLIDRTLEEVPHGTLTLELEPADALVTLADGRSYRAGMKLAEGGHRVRVTREGYREASLVVPVKGDTRLRIALERAPQPFTLATTPAHAEVRFLDMAETYRPGMTLPAGTYRVRVSAEGWESQEATVRHGIKPTLHVVELTRGPQAFTVVVHPPHAEVQLLDVTESYSPGITLPPGTYRIRVSAEGWETQELTAWHGAEEPTRYSLKLKPEPQSFTVVATPPDAEIRLLDVAQEYRPEMPLAAGTYRVRVSAEGWETQEATVRHGNEPTRAVIDLTREQSPVAIAAALGLTETDVKLIQRGLRSSGFDPGPADGVFGKGTQRALRTWQVSQGHEATGNPTADEAATLIAEGRQAVDSGVSKHPGTKQFSALLGRAFSTETREGGVGWTDLHYAAALNLPGVVEALVAAGLAVDVRLKEGHVVFGEDLKETLESLGFTRFGPWTATGETPLMVAALASAREAAEALIAAGADIDATNEYGGTVLHFTARGNAPDLVGRLIGQSADVAMKDDYGDTPLHDAAWKNASEMAEWLLEQGADIEARNNQGETPLYRAAIGNARETAAFLIERGARINAADENGDTLLHLAARRNVYKAVAGLIELGADIEAKNAGDATPLLEALRTDASATANLLIESGAKIPVQDDGVWTLLHYAAKGNAYERAELLIKAGAKVDAKNSYGHTPLHEAAESNARETARTLLDNHADIEAKTDFGGRPLHRAAMNNSYETAQLLIDRGAKINARAGGRTPLYYSLQHDALETLQLLIDRGARVNADFRGFTLLHYAADYGALRSMEFLIARDFDVNATTKSLGETPLDVAGRTYFTGKKSEMVKLLRRHGGRTGNQLRQAGSVTGANR